MHFDYNFAADSLRFYDSKFIPTIRKEDIPSNVSAVHFRSDLTNVDSIDSTGFKENSKLFNSL